MQNKRRRAAPVAVACAFAMALGACGGGGAPSRPVDEVNAAAQGDTQSCAAALGSYMRDLYYFSDSAPHPDPAGFTSIESYFYAQLFTVSDRSVASDHWSFIMDTSEFDSYFAKGETVGFGLEIVPHFEGDTEVAISTVDAGSPAAVAGLRRGDRIVAIDGQPVSSSVPAYIDADIYAARAGQTLTLSVRSDGLLRPVSLRAAPYNLSLLHRSTVLSTPNGLRVAYLRLDAFVDTVGDQLSEKLEAFDADGSVSKEALILDLRYDRGGSLDLARALVTDLVGTGHTGQVMAHMQFNRQNSQYDHDILFPATSMKGWRKVYVLSGPDTCSASEFVINALRPYVEVTQIGSTTCGKPFGFFPQKLDACPGKVFNAVNFEVVNRDNEGRYYSGLTPQCPVHDDLAHEPGDESEGLTAAALSHIDTHLCPPVAVAARSSTALRSAAASAMATTASARGRMWLRTR